MTDKDPMFRYLEKHYLGKYRILAAYDLDTQDFPREEDGTTIEESFDEQYIPCRRGEIRASARMDNGEPILVWYTDKLGQGHNVHSELVKANKKMWLEVDEIGSFDYFIYFKDSDFKKVADIVEPRTSGASINPYSNKNLPKPDYVIPEKDLAEFDKILAKMDKKEKMVFVKKCYSDFDAIIQKKKGKRFDVELERMQSKMKPKMFIHSLGLWNDFVKFTKERYNETHK